uniref:Prominin n=1 Tax=Siphoviridae sp. ct0eR1 TaxID=2825297 RepID=A0A8S5UH61_9CAUD|nr:MAG TPA: Prominin [Siphoviridae sp. ct0eR1]
MLSLPSACWRPPCSVLASPFRLRGGPVEWRGWRVLWCSVFGLGLSLHVVPGPLVLSSLLFLLCCCVCCGCGGGAGGGLPRCETVACFSSLFVFTVTVLLVRVVCLWQGCVIVEWRWCGEGVWSRYLFSCFFSSSLFSSSSFSCWCSG